MTVRRRRDYWIWYDTERGTTIPISQRTYEGDGIQTPITPLFLARVITGDVPRQAITTKIEPRTVNACFANPANQTGETNLKIFSPYRSGDSNLYNHLLEIRRFPGVLAIDYKGEVWPF